MSKQEAIDLTNELDKIAIDNKKTIATVDALSKQVDDLMMEVTEIVKELGHDA